MIDDNNLWKEKAKKLGYIDNGIEEVDERWRHLIEYRPEIWPETIALINKFAYK